MNQVELGGLVYPANQTTLWKVNKGWGSAYHYFNPSDKFYDKQHLRVYNHKTNQVFYLERVYPTIGDNNLLFVDFPRTDGYVENQKCTQYAIIRTWSDGRSKEHSGDFVRFTIEHINEDRFCRINDGYNKPSGVYASNCFYKINKILS